MAIKKAHYPHLIFSIVFSATFIFLFLHNASWSGVAQVAQKCNVNYLTLAIITLLFCFAIRLLRWKFILHKHHNNITLSKCFAPYFSSFAINNVLPFRLGDVARATLFNKHLNIDVHTVVSSLLIERIVDLVSLLILFYISFLIISVNTFRDPIFFYIIFISTAAFLLIILALIFPKIILSTTTAINTRLAKCRYPIVSRAALFINELAKSFYQHNNKRSILLLLLASLTAWFFEAVTFGLTAYSLNINLDIVEQLFVMSFSTLSALLPSTPGYVGTFHYLCKVSLNTIGIMDTPAITASIFMHAMIVVPVTIIGGVALIMHFGSSWKNILLNNTG